MKGCSITTRLAGIDNKTLLPNLDLIGNTFVSKIGYQSKGCATITKMDALLFILDPAVERPLECVPRGVRQGATRRRSGSTPTSCNAAGSHAGRAPGGVAAVTRRVSPRTTTIFKAVKALHEARSGQLPDLGS
jgi:hypothetical protein